MGVLDNAKERLAATGEKIRDEAEAAKDRLDDKNDEVQAEADLKNAEAERDRVASRNEFKEELRES